MKRFARLLIVTFGFGVLGFVLLPLGARAQKIYLATPNSFPEGQILKVDAAGAITVLETGAPGNGIAFGPDARIYLADGFVSASDLSGNVQLICSILSNCFTAEGPAFNGNNLFFLAADGLWELPNVVNDPLTGNTAATHVASGILGTTPPLGQGMTFTQFDSATGQLLPSGQLNLLIADYNNEQILVAAPPYTNPSPLVNTAENGGLFDPTGIAVDGHGEIFVANRGFINTARTAPPPQVVGCFNAQGQFQGIYASFIGTSDFPLYIKPAFLVAGETTFFLTTVQDENGNGGKLWRLDSPNPPGAPQCGGTGATVTPIADIGAAFSGGSVTGLESGAITDLAVNEAGAPLFVPAPLGEIFTSLDGPLGGFGMVIPAGASVPPHLAVQTVATAYTPQDFASDRLMGSAITKEFPNVACLAYPPDPCVVFHNLFFDTSTMMPITLPSTPGAMVSLVINNPNSGPIQPAVLATAMDTNNWMSVPSTFAIVPAVQNVDPLLFESATSDLNQDFVAATLGGTQTAVFEGFETPLALKNARTFTAGETIRVAFQLKNAAGKFVANANAQLSVVFLGIPANFQNIGAANFKSIAPNTFAYNPKSNAYEFYLDTTGYAAGPYSLTVYADSFAAQEVTFTIGAR